MGVDNINDVLSSDENAKIFGEQINKALSVGKRSTKALKWLQERDVIGELSGMGFDAEDIKKRYDTVEDFRTAIPSFVIAHSALKQKLESIEGKPLQLEANQDVCMTAGDYQRIARHVPSLVPATKKFKELYKPYSGEDLNGKTLFVWRSGGIGDLLFIRPLLMTLKQRYDVTIIFATRDKYHAMVEQWDDCIDMLSAVPFPIEDTLEAADYHISFEGLIERCKDAERYDVYDLFAMHACTKLDEYCFPMACSAKNRVFDVLPRDYAVLQIGSSSPIRTPLFGSLLPVANYLTQKTNLIISGSPHENRNIEDFISCCEDKDKIHNFARFSGSIIDAVKLITRSKLVVAPDSSHVHIAGHQGVPCVGIYGPFPWKCRATHYQNFIGVEPAECRDVCQFDGRHCFTHSYLPCEYGTNCWKHLDSNEIIDAVKKLMSWK